MYITQTHSCHYITHTASASVCLFSPAEKVSGREQSASSLKACFCMASELSDVFYEAVVMVYIFSV